MSTQAKATFWLHFIMLVMTFVPVLPGKEALTLIAFALLFFLIGVTLARWVWFSSGRTVTDVYKEIWEYLNTTYLF